MTVKKVVVEKEAISKQPSNEQMPARSKGPLISNELSDPQSPSPAYNNASNIPLSFAAPSLETSLASASTSREDNAVPEDSIPTPESASGKDNAIPEDPIKKSADDVDIVNLRSEDEESSAGSEPSHEPKPSMSYHPSNKILLIC